jgi:CMP-N-acetylneuraminic acid synthetase
MSALPPVNVAALLIIKAHSERVPGKNFRPLGGTPLFRWIVDALLAVPEIERVVIDTDARPLLSEGGLPASERIWVRDRPPELRGNHVTANALIRSVLPEAPARTWLMSHATNPFLRAETIRRALQAWHEASSSGRADSLVSVSSHQSRFYFSDGRPVNHTPDQLVPTQELPPLLEENSCLYVFTPESFGATGSRVGRAPLFFPTPRVESIDIDTEEDWELAALVAAGLS